MQTMVTQMAKAATAMIAMTTNAETYTRNHVNKTARSSKLLRVLLWPYFSGTFDNARKFHEHDPTAYTAESAFSH